MLTFYTFNEVIYNKKCLIEHIFYAYFYFKEEFNYGNKDYCN